MKIKHHDIIPQAENPFADCKLEREPYARVLTDVVNTYADGFVLAINNEWGTGKTTFVKMWQQQLKNEGFQTIYFNAWENDFDSNPLVAITSELETLINGNNGKAETFKTVIEKGSVLFKHMGPTVLKAIANKYLGSEVIADAVKSTTNATSEIFQAEIREYASRKKTIFAFREELEKFVKQTETTKPLIFIIDELDRCRPNYSVELLEQIKHLFSVKGIVFVLSIDKVQLGNAVKGFYGSEYIESNEYLRRFIDLEYSIPEPSTRTFTEYLFKYYGFNDFFAAPRRNNPYDANEFLFMAEFLLSKANETLRKQEKMFALTRLILCSFNLGEYTFPQVLFFLIYIKTIHESLFFNINNNKLSLQELSDAIGDLLLSESSKSNRKLCYIQAQLIWFYNNNRVYPNKIELIENDEKADFTTPIKSKLDENNEYLPMFFENISSENYETLELDFFLNKINLTESIKIQ